MVIKGKFIEVLDFIEGENIKEKKNILKNEKGNLIDIILNGENVEIKFENNLISTLKLSSELKELFKRRTFFKGVLNENLTIIKIVRYANLHIHSEYSILDSLNRINNIAKKSEYAVALTEHGNMFSSLKFQKEMLKVGKKPILGFEAYVEDFEGKGKKDGRKNRYHLLLLAKNQKGLKNLIKLTSLGFVEGFNFKPTLKYEWLREYNEGIICSTACIGGEVPQAILRGEIEYAEELVTNFKSIYGEDFYLEIQKHEIDVEFIINKNLLEIGKKLNVKCIATTDSHYTNKEDSYLHEIIICLNDKTHMNNPTRRVFEGTNYHIHSSEEMEFLYSDSLELLDNTLEIVDKIESDNLYDTSKIYMPNSKIPKEFKDESDYFKYLCEKGFKERFDGLKNLYSKEEYIKLIEGYRERLNFEMEIILKMGFPGYFIITWDFIKYAKDNNILVGPGRGSACGSMVAFVLKITDMNPMDYDLLFERFLNVDRASMPDIDVDFQDTRREEVIDYVKEKYGKQSVSKIITFGTMAAKMAIKDVARALDYSVSFAEFITEKISEKPGTKLAKELKENLELKELYENDLEVKKVYDIAMKLEGQIKNTSTHACGLVITDIDIDNFIPQATAVDKTTNTYENVTQVTMSECEELGLLKVDFLGLRTMGVISNCLELINKNLGKDEKITLENIPLNDLKTYEFLSEGETAGVFQLESSGMTNTITQLFQDVPLEIKKYSDLNSDDAKNKGMEFFERLIAGISLYRPGPIDEIPTYLDCMLNPENIVYDIPELEEILAPTYSVIVYQEECMQIVRKLANFTRGEADVLRKAFAKKKKELLPDLRKKFLKGCKENKIDINKAKSLWTKMEKFGAYAFNKSHAGGYGYISIKSGWLACHFPVEYMCANLNSIRTKAPEVKKLMAFAKKKKINILSPNINLSLEEFSVEGNSIRFGLAGIKNVGKFSNKIIQEREKNGVYKDYQDFIVRTISDGKSNAYTSLIMTSCLDHFIGTRRAKIAILDDITKFAKNSENKRNAGQLNLFDLVEDFNLNNDEKEDFLSINKVKTPEINEFDIKYILAQEKELTGLYINEHPVDRYLKNISEKENNFILNINEVNPKRKSGLINEIDLVETQQLEEVEKSKYLNKMVRVIGVVNNAKTLYTKAKNERMLGFNIEDKEDDINCIVFAKETNEYGYLVSDGEVVVVEGVFSNSDYGLQIKVKRIINVEQLMKVESPKEIILIGNVNLYKARMEYASAKNVSNKYIGDIPLYFIRDNKKYHLNDIKCNLISIYKLQEIVGENNCKFIYN